MIKQIWKYPLPSPVTELHIPDGGKVLHVHEQGGDPTIWVEVDPSARTVPRRFMVVGTGHSFISEGHTYLGTVHLAGGPIILVFHVYEVN